MNATPLVLRKTHRRATAWAVGFATLLLSPLTAQTLALTPFSALEPPASESGEIDVRLRLDEPVRARAEREPSRAKEDEPTGREPARAGGSAVPLAFCFGPLFGNNDREVDPNYLPPPVGSIGGGGEPILPQRAHYTRVAESEAGKTTWVGDDGSRITYASRLPRAVARERAAGVSDEDAARRQSVEELIAEHRREMTGIAWERVYRRFPELARAGGEERAEFEAYLLERRANAADAILFEGLMWPETMASAFMAERAWQRAEAASWDRVRARVRSFEDPGSSYTRRFFEFAEGLRADPATAPIFEQPNWPEKALELHDERLGPVPPEFR